MRQVNTSVINRVWISALLELSIFCCRLFCGHSILVLMIDHHAQTPYLLLGIECGIIGRLKLSGVGTVRMAFFTLFSLRSLFTYHVYTKTATTVLTITHRLTVKALRFRNYPYLSKYLGTCIRTSTFSVIQFAFLRQN